MSLRKQGLFGSTVEAYSYERTGAGYVIATLVAYLLVLVAIKQDLLKMVRIFTALTHTSISNDLFATHYIMGFY